MAFKIGQRVKLIGRQYRGTITALMPLTPKRKDTQEVSVLLDMGAAVKGTKHQFTAVRKAVR